MCRTYILNVSNNGIPLKSGEFEILLGSNIIEKGVITNGVSPPLNLERLKIWHCEYEIRIHPSIT